MKILFIFIFILVSCGQVRQYAPIDGKNGQDGFSLVATSAILQANAACPAGGSVTAIYKDFNRDGEVTLGIDVIQSTFIVCNGSQGVAGESGANGINGTNGQSSILSVINLRHDVCGLPEVNFAEVVLKLADGRYLSSFSDNAEGSNTRFTILVPGVTYRTTDGNSCLFKINSQNELVRL